MSPMQPNEDLFEGTKMTFGEHLEELRVALFRSLIGLIIGVFLGLGVARHVVETIQGPLTLAMQDYYMNKSVDDLRSKYGEPDPSVIKFMRDKQVIFDEVYLERDQVRRINEYAEAKDESSSNAAESSPTGPVVGEPDIGMPSSEMVKTRLWKPLSATIKSLNAHEVFMIWLKAATITGAMIASPWIFLQIWNFVATGLYPQERNYVHVFMPISLGLFFAGAALAFFFVFKPVLDFLFSFNKTMNIDPDPRISEWLSFVIFMPLGFGISFQLPLVMFMLNRIGIVSLDQYIEKWRIAVLIIFVLAMFLTPADPISMLLLAAPLTVLYFGGIAMCKWMPKRQSPFGEGYDPS